MRAKLLALLIVLALLPLPRPALAQESVTLRFDFAGTGDGSAQGWYFDAAFDQDPSNEDNFEVATYPARCPDDGWCLISGGWHDGKAFTAVYSLGGDVEIESISFSLNSLAEGLERYVRVRVYTSAMDVVLNTQYNLNGPGGQLGRTVIPEEPVTGRYVVIHCHTEWSVMLDWVEITATEAPEKSERYTYPLNQGEFKADLFPYSAVADALFSSPPVGNDEMLGYAGFALEPVHSPFAGVVVDVSPFENADCSRVVQSAASEAGAAIAGMIGAAHPVTGIAIGAAQFIDIMAWQGAGANVSYCRLRELVWNEYDFGNDTGLNDYYVPIAGDLVTIQSSVSGDLVTYLVMDSEYFVEVGSPVTPGCVLGATLPMWIGRLYPAPQEYTGMGYGAIWATDSTGETELNILDRYGDYPTGDLSCNIPSYVDCLNENPRFDYLGMASWSWAFTGSTGAINPDGEVTGLLLSESGVTAASQALMLNSDLPYSIKVIAHVQTPNSGFTDSGIVVSLGTTDHDLDVPYTGEQTEFIIDAQTYTADIGSGVYTVGVALEAGEDGEIVIDFLCISDNDDPVMERPTCLFTNPGFDQASDWTLTGTAEIVNGFLRMAENDTASQTITLAADTYTLEISARGEAGGPDTSTITIGGASSGQFAVGDYLGVDYWQAQSFVPSVDGTITQLTIDHLGISGSPSGTMTAEIRSASGSDPGTVLWSGAYTPSLNATNTINVASGPEVTASTTYWLVFRPTNPQADNNWWWVSYVNNSYAGGASANSNNGGSTWTATPSYDLDLSVSVSYVTSGTNIAWSLGAVADGTLTPGADWTIVSEAFTLAEAADGATFTLEPDAAAQIDYVCLIPANQPTAPPEPDYPDIRDCNSCPIDLTGDVAHDVYESTAWHDCRFRQVYYCDMRKILVDIRTNTANTVRGIGMFGRYTGAVATVQLKFLQGMAYYLAGYLNNVALAIQDSIAWQSGYSTVITDGGLGFWDVLGLLITGLRDVLVTALDRLGIVIGQLFTFLAPIVGTLLSVLESAVDLLISVIETIFDQLQILQYLISAVVTGANNATPEAIPGAPNCTANPEGLCWGIYLLDNTIFSGPVKDLLPILAGAMTLNLLVWTIGKFRHVFENLA